VTLTFSFLCIVRSRDEVRKLLIFLIAIGVIINLACDSPAFGGRLSIGNFNSMGIAFYALTASMNLFVTVR
jgi:hypothetical protein